jgi:hypothetical protein
MDKPARKRPGQEECNLEVDFSEMGAPVRKQELDLLLVHSLLGIFKSPNIIT